MKVFSKVEKENLHEEQVFKINSISKVIIFTIRIDLMNELNDSVVSRNSPRLHAIMSTDDSLNICKEERQRSKKIIKSP
jgi:hypothetical protein